MRDFARLIRYCSPISASDKALIFLLPGFEGCKLL